MHNYTYICININISTTAMYKNIWTLIYQQIHIHTYIHTDKHISKDTFKYVYLKMYDGGHCYN